MKKFNSILIALALFLSYISGISQVPERELRGAWMHTVFQDGYLKRSTEENKAYLISQLDRLSKAGVNAVFFQVRPQADAFYASALEPWSRYLTTGAKAPAPYWDPLEFMIQETHKRGMELHAWFNPYRVTASKTQKPENLDLYSKHPERFVSYGGKIFFNPGLPENMDYIVEVVKDVTSRYDIDGIHFDDYFYPYPEKGIEFADSKEYRTHGNGLTLDDWRRSNVDSLIKKVHQGIKEIKPWVRFGISPFGIWRNKTSDPNGSDTRGLENYDALYADVLLWAHEGWVDYLMPQLYWELDHKTASTRKLLSWWAQAVPPTCHLYIGHDVERSQKCNETEEKVELGRALNHYHGVCWWPGYSVTSDFGGFTSSLRKASISHQVLPPAYAQISKLTPHPVTALRSVKGELRWEKPADTKNADAVNRYAIYSCSPSGTGCSLIAVTHDNSFRVPGSGYYTVCAISRANQVSAPHKPVAVK
ncbi:MAG: family 10 glycosylhydrolase [Muribaculaceae bacterium]|nr:family 10 glycosylhydrolase [Muribaculaceae bacterium]